jgi:hypothetical protein
MESWNTLPINQIELKSHFSVLMKESRNDRGESLMEVSARSGLPIDILHALEANNFEASLDLNLVKTIAQGYNLKLTEVGELVRVACVSKLVDVMRALDDAKSD